MALRSQTYGYLRNPLIIGYYSFIDPGRIKGWVGWPIADSLLSVVTCPTVGRAQDRDSSPAKMDDLPPLCYAAKHGHITQWKWTQFNMQWNAGLTEDSSSWSPIAKRHS